MRYIIVLIIGISWIADNAVLAQQKQGRVSYDIAFSSDDPQTSAYIDQMEGSILEVYFGEKGIRTETYMGEFMTTINISNQGNDTTLTLLDGMMGKIAMKTTIDDLEDEQQLAISEREVELVDETKEIMGYTCKKAVITTADDQESIAWYTEEIVPSYRYGQYLYEEIPGVLLQMESTWGKMNMKMVAFEYKKKLKKPEQLFSMDIPKGYTLRTAEEMKAMRQGRRE
jgi:GLPGLI family protein